MILLQVVEGKRLRTRSSCAAAAQGMRAAHACCAGLASRRLACGVVLLMNMLLQVLVVLGFLSSLAFCASNSFDIIVYGATPAV